MNEQRRSRRYQLRLPVELIRAGAQRFSHVGETRNLSSTGVLFTSPTNFEVGDLVEYLITLRGTESGGVVVRLRCMGKVLRLEATADNGSRIAASLERYEFIRI